MKKNNSIKGSKSRVEKQKHRNQERDFQKWVNPSNLFLLVTFVFFAFYFLAIINENLVSRIQELSLFLPTKYFFVEHVKIPGGILTWLSTFFIQFFYYPWLGSLFFIILALLVQFLAIKAFSISSRLYVFTFVIPFALLLTVTQLGYMIYAVKLHYFIFTPLLGLSAVLLVFWGYKSLMSLAIRTIAITFIMGLVYPLIGFYALLTCGLVILFESQQFVVTKSKVHFIPVVTAIILSAILPNLLFVGFYTQLELARVYTIGLPELYEPEQFCWIPFLAIAFVLLVCYFLSFRNHRNDVSLLTLLSGASVYFISLYGLFHFSYSDANFQAELVMEKAASENRWTDVLSEARNQQDEPTRLMVMHSRLALQKLNRGGDELFSYPNGNKETNSPWPTQLQSISGKLFFYQYGKLNYSYQAAMDDMVERGMKVDDLKYMVKCALLNNELKLAQKYNDALKITLFYKDWSSKYQKYIDNPNLMVQDVEFAAILPLTHGANEMYDSSILEKYLLDDFARNYATTHHSLEIAIQNALILRNSKLFWPHFFQYLQLNVRIPIHYQEAALLFSFYEGNKDLKNGIFDPSIVAGFHEFEEFLDQNRANTKEMNKNLLAPTFGHTFWYYFFFSAPIVSS